MSGEPLTIPEMVRQSAGRFRSALALWERSADGPVTLSFAELWARVLSYRAKLWGAGARPKDHIAIIAPNSIEWAVAFLGITSLGAVAVPIYFRLQPNEQQELARKADVKFAVVGPTPGGALPEPPPGVTRTFVIDAGDGGSPAGVRLRDLPEAAVPDDIAVGPEDLALILFTSGTMGAAKGVMLTHRNLLTNVWAISRAVKVGPSDRVLLVLPMHHPYPLTVGLLTPLAVGAATGFENDLRRTADRMGEFRPTIFLGVPELFRLLLRAVFTRAESEGRLEALRRGMELSRIVKEATGVNIGRILFRSLHARLGGRIRFMVSGGAALPPELARQYYRLGLLLVQGWGLSETAPVLTVPEVSEFKFLFTSHYEREAGTVGRPLPGVRLRLLDVPEKGIYVREHGLGELAAQGPNVSPGYYKNPAATAAVFFEDESGRWFRTGDIGWIAPNGNVYLTGRAKAIIVLDTGEKVSPDEVEDVLKESPLIQDVAVFGRRVVRGGHEPKMEVHAVIFPNPQAVAERLAREGVAQPTPELIHAWVTAEVRQAQQRLAPYKWVREIILSDEPLPKTALGKVRRGELGSEFRFDLERFLAQAAVPTQAG